MNFDKFEYVGGNIWTLVATGVDGYECHKISVEIGKGTVPWIISYEPSMVTISDIQKLIELIASKKNT